MALISTQSKCLGTTGSVGATEEILNIFGVLISQENYLFLEFTNKLSE